MRPEVILIDDGGVMNDNDLRGHQWKGLCGQFFAPRPWPTSRVLGDG
jgi:hypothetical protein